MKVTPIIETATQKPYRRPLMVLHWDKHTVVAPDGKRYPLPPKQAWDMYRLLDVTA